MKKVGISLFAAFLMCFAVSSASEAGDVQAGEKLYQKKCAMCHGNKGQGAMAGKINDPQYLMNNTDEVIKGVITNGVKGMPSYKNSLKPDEIDALVSFIRSWAQ